MNSVQAYVASGTSSIDQDTQTQVSSSETNFTTPINKKLYLVVSPQNGATSGFDASFTINYYLYDPRCAINKAWNGTDCIVDYDYYCESLTTEYREQLNEPELEVFYNGEYCVYETEETVTIETIEYVYTSSTEINGTSTEEINAIVNVIPYTGPMGNVVISAKTLKSQHKAVKE